MKKTGIVSLLAAGVIALASHGALAAGNAEKGAKVFRKCKACHSLEAGKKKIGPSLAGMFGRKAGMVDGFKYSKAMKESGIVWDEKSVSDYLANPKKFIPKNRMAFPGLKKEQDRADVIAYLLDATK
jgi:cytochrome c